MLSFENIRRLPLILFILVYCSVPSFSQNAEKTKQFELENGLKVFLYERHSVPLINLAFAVNCGSKDETEKTSGIVHILEHYIMFRGTEFRSGEELAQDIREHGAYFNAHTSRDLAYFEMTLPSENGDFGLELQKEILFNLNLTQEDLDDEKEVILEEINKISDDPLRYASAIAYQNLFKGHPYQNPIYGNRESIKNLTVDQVQEFYSRFFVPNNSSLVVLGDFNLSEMEEKVRSLYGDLTNKNFSSVEFESVPKLSETVRIEKEMDVNLGYLVIGMLGPDYNSPDQYSIDLLSEILGRGVNPLIYTPLSQRRLFANSLSLSYGANKYGGAIFITVSIDHKNINIAEKEIIKYLKSLRKERFSKDDYVGESQFYAIDYLGNAKNQIKFRAHESQEKGLSVAVSLARYLLIKESSEDEDDNYLENIEKLTSSDLRISGGRYMGTGRYVIVSIKPPKK